MFDLNTIINIPPFSMKKQEKEGLYKNILHDLTKYHYENCLPYRKILNMLSYNLGKKNSLEDIPFIPVRLFKTHELISVDKSNVIKVTTSSGTSGKAVSKIFLDRATATIQTKVLAKIASSLIGEKRLPMLIIDTQSTLKNRRLFSARGAGIIGFSMLGRDITYALHDNMEINFDIIKAFCDKYRHENVLLFGFTHIVWEYFYKALVRLKQKLPLSQGVMIHGGGWKKLIDQSVDNNAFNTAIRDVCGMSGVFNYYGMVEQTGSIFMECKAGFLHCSIFSDVIIRDRNFSICNKKERGMIQLISLLPFSYPGHSILSEDIGEIIGEDDCSCGKLGKYFKVHGRVEEAETRGCSDTYTSNE